MKSTFLFVPGTGERWDCLTLDGMGFSIEPCASGEAWNWSSSRAWLNGIKTGQAESREVAIDQAAQSLIDAGLDIYPLCVRAETGRLAHQGHGRMVDVGALRKAPQNARMDTGDDESFAFKHGWYDDPSHPGKVFRTEGEEFQEASSWAEAAARVREEALVSKKAEGLHHITDAFGAEGLVSREPKAQQQRLAWLLGQVMDALPANRDWLDPAVEREAKVAVRRLLPPTPDLGKIFEAQLYPAVSRDGRDVSSVVGPIRCHLTTAMSLMSQARAHVADWIETQRQVYGHLFVVTADPTVHVDPDNGKASVPAKRWSDVRADILSRSVPVDGAVRQQAYCRQALEHLTAGRAGAAELCAYEAGRFGGDVPEELQASEALTRQFGKGAIDVLIDRIDDERAASVPASSDPEPDI